MASQPVERRRCLSCNRWGGARTPGPEPETVAYDETNDRFVFSKNLRIGVESGLTALVALILGSNVGPSAEPGFAIAPAGNGSGIACCCRVTRQC